MIAKLKQQHKKTAILRMHCPDQPGIIAVITQFITENQGNIIYLDQYVDRVNGVFYMRVEWELDRFLIPSEKIDDYFNTLYAQRYCLTYKLSFSSRVQRMAIFVSKMSHCLYDMLSRYVAGEWDVEIPVIISNHPDLAMAGQQFGIPFEGVPVTRYNKGEMEQGGFCILDKYEGGFILLARYMQILWGNFINPFPKPII